MEVKESFKKRIEKQVGKQEANKFFETLQKRTRKALRVNTLKSSFNEIKKTFKENSWNFKEYPELNAFVIESELNPGELGKKREHQTGNYYIQELTSMLPVYALNPKEDELVLDLCAAPGSKTTQLAMFMKNKGTIFANEVKKDRINILSSNLERCGVTNTILTQEDGLKFCKVFNEEKFLFDKILIDAPCSGEGTIMNDPEAMKIWNENMIKKFSRIQKNLIESAFKILKPQGALVYSTCTLDIEEDEEVIQYLLEKYPAQIKIEKVSFPLKSKEGTIKYQNKKLDNQIKNCAKFWPQDNGSEGFFVAKIIKIKDKF